MIGLGFIAVVVAWCTYSLGRKHGRLQALDTMEVAYAAVVPAGSHGLIAVLLRLRWQLLLEREGRRAIARQADAVRASFHTPKPTGVRQP